MLYGRINLSVSQEKVSGEGLMEPLLTVEKAAELLGISPWTVRAYLRDAKLMAVHIGRRVLIEPSELRRFVEDAKKASHISSLHELRATGLREEKATV